MIPEEPPGVPLPVAVMLVCVLLCMIALGCIVATIASTRFQRRQDRRWVQPTPGRIEWVWIGWRVWWKSIMDNLMRRG